MLASNVLLVASLRSDHKLLSLTIGVGSRPSISLLIIIGHNLSRVVAGHSGRESSTNTLTAIDQDSWYHRAVPHWFYIVIIDGPQQVLVRWYKQSSSKRTKPGRYKPAGRVIVVIVIVVMVIVVIVIVVMVLVVMVIVVIVIVVIVVIVIVVMVIVVMVLVVMVIVIVVIRYVPGTVFSAMQPGPELTQWLQ